MKSPKVSVLIPTYNYARYLPEAIESVLQQEFADFEVLIADDCSTDHSAAIIQDFARRDSRIRYQFHSPNMGMVANWNWCLQQARGDYVKYLFGDDRLAGPQSLGTLVAALDAAPTATLAASARYVLDEQSRIVDLWNPLSTGLHRGAAVIMQCLAQDQNLIGEPTAVMFRRHQGQRGFHPAYRQLVDLEMWFHLLESGDLVYIAEPLCCFRRHSRQQTVVNERDRVGQYEGLQLLATYAAKPGLSKEALLRHALFIQVYHARKARRRDPRRFALAQPLQRQLGWPWYLVYWVRRRLTQPFKNLRRAIRQRQRVFSCSGSAPAL